MTQIKPLRGFDRLATAGLGPSEIAVLRAQFHGERGFGFDVENILDIPHEYTTDGEVVDNRKLLPICSTFYSDITN